MAAEGEGRVEHVALEAFKRSKRDRMERELTMKTFLRFAETRANVGARSRAKVCVRGGVRVEWQVLRVFGEGTRKRFIVLVRVGDGAKRKRGDGR